MVAMKKYSAPSGLSTPLGSARQATCSEHISLAFQAGTRWSRSWQAPQYGAVPSRLCTHRALLNGVDGQVRIV